MNNYKFLHTYFFKGLLAVAFALSLFALTPSLASAQTYDDWLVSDCSPAENCTANDFGPITVTNVQVVTAGCYDWDNNSSTPDSVRLNFDLTYTSLSPTRYDIGALIALDGGLAMRGTVNSGVCVRDWLEPSSTEPYLTITDPAGVTTWPVDNLFWDGEQNNDLCGDLPSNDKATTHFTSVDVACVDNYPVNQDGSVGDGQIDLNICLIYDNNAKDDCHLLPDPTTGTTAKCQCETVNIPVTPTAIEGLTFSASSRALPVGLALSGLGLVVIGGVLLTVYLRRRAGA